jgi:hypothetical protein
MKQKFVFSILILSLILITGSCKKSSPAPSIGITNSQLIGTWNEQSPCAAGAGSCFVFQFTSNYRCYESSPGTDSPAYRLSGDSIYFLNDQYLSSYKLDLTGDSVLTIEKLFVGAYIGSPPPGINVTLKKM